MLIYFFIEKVKLSREHILSPYETPEDSNRTHLKPRYGDTYQGQKGEVPGVWQVGSPKGPRNHGKGVQPLNR